MTIVRRNTWTDEDIQRLATIIAAGGTPLRAAAASKAPSRKLSETSKDYGNSVYPKANRPTEY